MAPREEELAPVPNRIARIHHSFFQKNGVVPLGVKGDPPTLVVAVSEGGRRVALGCARASSSNMPLEKKRVPKEEFLEYLNTFREEQGREVVIGVVEDLGESALTEIAQEIPSGHDLLDDAANEPPIIKLVNLLFSIAAKDRASDIHIQPLEKDLRVRYRIDGLLYDTYTPPKRAQNAIVSRIKVMAGLDVAEKRLPQDGRIKVRVNDKDIDVRVSIIPSAYGEQVVMRLLDRGGGADKPRLRGHEPGPRKEDRLPHHQAPGRLPRDRPDRLRQDHHALRRAPVHQHAGKEHPDRGRPGGVYPAGHRPDTGQPEDTARFREGPPVLS